MPDRKMMMVYCYDIASPRIRARVARELEKFAVRVQGSVFEARLTCGAADRHFAKLSAMIEPTDSLRMYGLSATGLERTRVSGLGTLPQTGDDWII